MLLKESLSTPKKLKQLWEKIYSDYYSYRPHILLLVDLADAGHQRSFVRPTGSIFL
jgi:hypothetical protein